ncbi:MAG: hypothetical protein QXI33_03210 [Candidatus Pacearchaeota archaeon]
MEIKIREKKELFFKIIFIGKSKTERDKIRESMNKRKKYFLPGFISSFVIHLRKKPMGIDNTSIIIASRLDITYINI